MSVNEVASNYLPLDEQPRPSKRRQYCIRAIVTLIIIGLSVAVAILALRKFHPPKPVARVGDGISQPTLDRIRYLMDPAADPCTDFYEYACGGWKPQIDTQDPNWHVYNFDAVANTTRHQQLDLMTRNFPFIGTFFQECMDLPALDESGGDPLRKWFSRIDTATGPDAKPEDFWHLLGSLHRSSLLQSWVVARPMPFDAHWRFLLATSANKLGPDPTNYFAGLALYFNATGLAHWEDLNSLWDDVRMVPQLYITLYNAATHENDVQGHGYYTDADFGSFPIGAYVAGTNDALQGKQATGKFGPPYLMNTASLDNFNLLDAAVRHTYEGSKMWKRRHMNIMLKLLLTIENLPLLSDAITTAYRTRPIPPKSFVASLPAAAITHVPPPVPVVPSLEDFLKKTRARPTDLSPASPGKPRQRLQSVAEDPESVGRVYVPAEGDSSILPALPPSPPPPIDPRHGARDDANSRERIAGDRRQEQCRTFTIGLFADYLSHQWIVDKWPLENKVEAVRLVDLIYQAMGKRIAEVDWLDKPTMKKALEKWSMMVRNIGYSSDWDTYPGLKLGQGLFEDYYISSSYLNAREYDRKDAVARRDLIFTHDYTEQNAFYVPALNNINLLAGLLLDPFFSATNPDLLNLAAYGWVIGHEITHGFDTNGMRYNGTGHMEGWWTQSSYDKFSQRATCLAEQYSGYDHQGNFVNGLQTLGENIADQGGIRLAWNVWKNFAKSADLAPTLGLSNDQLFWVYAGQTWCQAQSDVGAMMQVLSDVHSPGKFRVLGSFSNMKGFADTFKCGKDKPMGRSKTKEACSIW